MYTMIGLSISKARKDQDFILLDRNLTDMIKFIACIMVAMSHYSGYALANGLSSSMVYKLLAATGGYLGVAIFFFLSGYGLMKSAKTRVLGVGSFIKRRLVRTWLPAILVSAIWLVIAGVLRDWGLLSNRHYFLGIFWWFNDEVMWFVRVILVMYVFFGLYRATPPQLYGYRCIILFVVGFAAYLVVRFSGIGSSLSVPLFFLGVAVADFPHFFRRICTSATWIFVMLAIAVFTVWICRDNNYLMHGWINYFVWGLLVVVFANFNIQSSFSLNGWGCSYDVYLVHYKTHLLILRYFPVDALWMFVLGSTVATVLFYRFRKFWGI